MTIVPHRTRLRRTVLLCAALFASVPVLVAFADLQSARAGEQVITNEGLRDAKWPSTTDC